MRRILDEILKCFLYLNEFYLYFVTSFVITLQYIEDLTQEKFSLQRTLEASKSLTESLAAENSSLTESYNQQVGDALVKCTFHVMYLMTTLLELFIIFLEESGLYIYIYIFFEELHTQQLLDESILHLCCFCSFIFIKSHVYW